MHDYTDSAVKLYEQGMGEGSSSRNTKRIAVLNNLMQQHGVQKVLEVKSKTCNSYKEQMEISDDLCNALLGRTSISTSKTIVVYAVCDIDDNY